MICRFRREEMKIQAWENHQKAKSEAEMRKTEVSSLKKDIVRVDIHLLIKSV